MTEERIRQITDAVPIQGSATVLRDLVAAAIRQALAERDREIKEWAKADACPCPGGDGEQMDVDLDDLLHFLEVGENAT